MHRNKFTEDYEFDVSKIADNEGIAGYSVSLPHQCDDWEIVGADEDDESVKHNESYPALPLSKDVAIKQMELFIKRAQEALQKLKEL